MKIKEREKDNFFYYLRKPLNIIYRGIFNKKTKIIFFSLVAIILLFIGMLSGLIISGFFGTFDNPSQNAIDILHSIGISNLRGYKAIIEGIKRENIRIPINYIKGKLSNPEKIFIDIGFLDFQKIKYKRQQALDSGFLLSYPEDYVPATIRYKDKEVRVRLRLKGDLMDHIDGDKWSFRIKVRDDDTLFGMKTFSIQKPETRVNLNEFIYQNALKREGVLFVRYDFIEVVINGKNKGIYAIEEHFENQLIENNNRRVGVIIKFDTDLVEQEELKARDYLSDEDWWEYISNPNTILGWFYNSNIGTFNNNKILEDPVLSKQFKQASNLLESFRRGSLQTHEVFDIDKLAKYFAINTILNCQHASESFNIRFYYNPITSLLEPIGYDGHCNYEYSSLPFEHYLPDCLSIENDCPKTEKNFYELIFSDKIFFEKYMQELETFSKKSYLDNLFLELKEEIKRTTNIMHKDYPLYRFPKESFYKNQERIWSYLNPIKSMNIYFQKSLSNKNKIVLLIGNIGDFPVEIINLVYNNSITFKLNQKNKIIQPKTSRVVSYRKFEFKVPANFNWNDSFILDSKVNYKIFGLSDVRNESIFPWPYVEEDFTEKDFIRQKPTINSFDFLNIDNNARRIFFKKGNLKLNKNLIIPEGFTVFVDDGTVINLINNATILSYSPIVFSGTRNNPIKIISSDGSGQGIAVLNAEEVSELKYVVFENLNAPFKKGWELTGAISFYNSPVKLEGVVISGNNAEDSLNIINSEFEISDSVFKNCVSDCFDDDFSNGFIKDSKFDNCGNDCVDISGAVVNINNVEISGASDKGVSIGEKSNVIINNLEVEGGLGKTYIGVASKDKSKVEIENSKISNAKYGLAVYQKKPEFGSASIRSTDVDFFNVDNDYIVEIGSNLLFNGESISGSEQNVYETLYGVVK